MLMSHRLGEHNYNHKQNHFRTLRHTLPRLQMSSRTKKKNCPVISENNNQLIREIFEAEKISRLEENCVTKPCLNLSEKGIRLSCIQMKPKITTKKNMSYCLKRQAQVKKKKYKSELQVSAA
ncbi:unnamed protein product [Ixodes pacificus]